MHHKALPHGLYRTLMPALLLAVPFAAVLPGRAAEPRVAVPLHAGLTPALRGAKAMGRLPAQAPFRAALTLPLRNQAQLAELLRRQYTPGDVLYHQYLTPAEFGARFSPTEADYAAVSDWATSQGLVVLGTHASRAVLDIGGTTAQVEAAFGVTLGRYKLSDGRVVFANNRAPRVPRPVAARLAGVAGLSSLSRMVPHHRLLTPQSGAGALAGPRIPRPLPGQGGIGTGPAGGLAPNDIKYAYNLSVITPLYGTTVGGGGTPGTGTGAPGTGTTTGTPGTGTTTGTVAGAPLDGTGQTIGLFELDGYDPKDIALYVQQFGLPTALGTPATATTLATGVVQTVLLDGYSGVPTSIDGQSEVTLDIDMLLALVPNATNIYSYEADQNTSATASIDLFNQMADDLAPDGKSPLLQVISSSWGIPEKDEDPAVRDAENTVFQKMAAQGQSIFNAAGDSGAFDRFRNSPTGPLGVQPAVDNPASQPFMTGVGGTTLKYKKPATNKNTGLVSPGFYVSEAVWASSSLNSPNGPAGGGGGSSEVWPKPDYQLGYGSSPTTRDVPDVALDADPNSGYDIFVAGKAETYGGTSAAAPLWAGFIALVNQQRAANGLGTVGFLNPTLYALGRANDYPALFHDVVTGSNLLYQAGPGYDDATGFGSFIGDALLARLSANADMGTGTAVITGTVTDTSAPPLPIAGAVVSAVSVATGAVKATATTDASGAYTLTVPSGLALNITVSGPSAATTTTGTPGTPGAPPIGTGTGTGTTTTTGPVYAGQTDTGLNLTTGQALTLNFALNAGHQFAAGLQMISSPYDYTAAGNFAAVFGLTTPLTSRDPRLIQWQPSLSVYAFYPTSPADTLRPGQAYWVKFSTVTAIQSQGAAVPAATFTIPLQQGWNQIGDPFAAPVDLAALSAATPGGAGASPIAGSALVQPILYRYDLSAGGYISLDSSTGVLNPYDGYWIFATQAAVLNVPPPSALPPPPIGSGPPTAPGG